jgi:hypothetical protein
MPPTPTPPLAQSVQEGELVGSWHAAPAPCKSLLAEESSWCSRGGSVALPSTPDYMSDAAEEVLDSNSSAEEVGVGFGGWSRLLLPAPCLSCVKSPSPLLARPPQALPVHLLLQDMSGSNSERGWDAEGGSGPALHWPASTAAWEAHAVAGAPTGEEEAVLQAAQELVRAVTACPADKDLAAAEREDNLHVGQKFRRAGQLATTSPAEGSGREEGEPQQQKQQREGGQRGPVEEQQSHLCGALELTVLPVALTVYAVQAGASLVHRKAQVRPWHRGLQGVLPVER